MGKLSVVSIVGLGLSLGLTGCQSGGGSGGSASQSSPQMSQFDVNKYAINKTVCNPLGGTGATSSEPSQGIQATLYWLDSSQPRYTDVGDMIKYGHQSDQNLFFSELFVPTRYFTEGFPIQSGGDVEDDQGNLLNQYFALRFESVLHLAPNDEEGDYQLGLLADDGAIWSVSTDLTSQNLKLIVNDDGTHPTQLGCGTVIPMTHASQLNMQLDYFQGPEYQIALVPIWRLVNSCTPPSESLCGQNGNTLYFNGNQGANSAPEAAFNKLLQDGWVPLGVGNYSIQQSATYNPCTQGTAPVITGVTATNNMDLGYYTISWTTDIPATDQVLYSDNAGGQQILTTSSNILSTSHSVNITGLLPAHTYMAQAVSISADLGKTISSPVTFTVN